MGDETTSPGDETASLCDEGSRFGDEHGFVGDDEPLWRVNPTDPAAETGSFWLGKLRVGVKAISVENLLLADQP